MERVDSIETMMREINSCLKHDDSLAALYIAISLPDICAKLMESKTNGKEARYCEWFDKYVLDYIVGKVGKEKYSELHFSSSECWKLRCFLYHEGNYDIESNESDEFLLNFNKSAVMATASASQETRGDKYGHPIPVGPKRIKKDINVNYLCEIIIYAVQDFLKEPYIKNKKRPTLKIHGIPSIFKARTYKDLMKDDL